ncbi:hypothetical protein BGZ63DRAFT_455576 [Mariannaea sp. PMI_226]|nr:hypothetical protein BGZ63DRAFT_455576 [Mariannaea sp. PMI_226]
MGRSNNRRNRGYHPYEDTSNRRDNNRAQKGRGGQRDSNERDFSPSPERSPRNIGPILVAKMELRAFKNEQGIIVGVGAVNRSPAGGPQTRIMAADPTTPGAVMVKTNNDNDIVNAYRTVMQSTGAPEVVVRIYPCDDCVNANFRRATGTLPFLPPPHPHTVAAPAAAATAGAGAGAVASAGTDLAVPAAAAVVSAGTDLPAAENNPSPVNNRSTNMSNIFQDLIGITTASIGSRTFVSVIVSPQTKKTTIVTMYRLELAQWRARASRQQAQMNLQQAQMKLQQDQINLQRDQINLQNDQIRELEATIQALQENARLRAGRAI